MEKRLLELRSRIDEIDRELARLISERLSICKKIGEVKSSLGLPVRDPVREGEVLSRVPEEAREAFECILRACVRLQEATYRNSS